MVPLDQLEPSVRAGLPPLQLSLHYYAPGTGNSMVRLDGVILREGDELQPGLLVDEIVADGVILSYKGRLILLHRPRG